MKRRSRRRGALEPIGNVLFRDAALRVPGSVDAAPLAYRDWELAVGTRIATRARPVRLDRGVLLVRAATSTWAQELTMLGDQILAQLRARGLRVDRVRFTVGAIEAPTRPPSRDEIHVVPAPVVLPPELIRQVEEVGDLDLRRAIADAAATNLGWQAALATARVKARAAAAPATSGPPDAPGPRGAGSRSARRAPASPPKPAGPRDKP